jgi:hypothetical protein
MTTQPPATPTPPQSPLFRFILEHPALVLGGVPLTLTMIRLLLVSQGDDAALAVLAQSLNVTTILVITLTTSLPPLLLALGLLVAQGEGARLLPDMPPARRRSYFVVAFSYTFLLLLFVSWRMAVIWLVASAAIVGLGLLFRWLWHRRGETSRQPLVEPVALVVPVVLSLALMGPWLPAERITLSNGSVRVGYVVAVGDPMTVLWREGGVVYLRPKDLKDRQICARTIGLGPGIMSLTSDKTERCPSDKVTRLKP